MPMSDRLDDRLVQGCQSQLYLKVTCDNQLLDISTYSDALISSGLAYLISFVYSNEPPEAVFKCPPLFIKEIGLLTLLSPSRSNGLSQLYKKLQQETLKWIS